MCLKVLNYVLLLILVDGSGIDGLLLSVDTERVRRFCYMNIEVVAEDVPAATV
jgi:hypothetical protein